MITEKREALVDKELISQAFSLISRGESICAREILDEILSEFPECAEAYLGLLMLEVGVNAREALNNENIPFNNSINYKNALKYADDELREFLTKIRTNPFSVDGEELVKRYSLRLNDVGAYYEVAGGCPENYTIKIPPYYKLKPICAIADEAFARPDNINSLIVYGLVDRAYKEPFSIELPATIKRIGKRAFASSLLTSITLPDGLLEIGEQAFIDCNELRQVSFPINPIKICQDAFANLHKLEGISIKSLSAWCENDIVSEGASPFWLNDAVICINDEPVRELVIPEGVIEIKAFCFANLTSILSLRLPDSLRKIGNCAFGLASNIECITFGDGLEVIGDYAFSGCERLKEVKLPHTIRQICAKAFTLCDKLRSLSLGGVEFIGEEAFEGCSSLSAITIPASIKTIGKKAFRRTNIKSLKILGAPDLIDEYAFEWCEELEDLKFEGARVIGNNAFCGCKKIKNVIIPSGTEIIGKMAFYDCDAIETLYLPDTITEIGASAFYIQNHTIKKIEINSLENWCSINFANPDSNPIGLGELVLFDGKEIEALVIPTEISKIKEFAFKGLSSLVEIVFHDGVTEICDNAFLSCGNLTEIKIPGTVMRIGRYAFSVPSGCPEKTIIIEKGVRDINANAFTVLYAEQKNTVFYEGSRAGLKAILTYGKKLDRCTVYYYSEKKTFLGGKQWRYVNGEPTPW